MMEMKSIPEISAWVYVDYLTLLAAWDPFKSVPMAAPSKLWVYGLLFAGIAGSNPTGGKDGCLLGLLCVVR